MTYALELDIKQDAVKNALRHIGGIMPGEYGFLPAIPCPDSEKRRNKAVYHVESGALVKCGFNAARSRDIIDIGGEKGCMMQSVQSTRALSVIRKWLTVTPSAQISSVMTRTSRDGAVFLAIMPDRLSDSQSKELLSVLKSGIPGLNGVVLCKKQKNTDSPGDNIRVLLGDGYAYDEILGCRFRLAAQSFFQVNARMSDELYTAAMSLDDMRGARILDAFCGAGTLSVCMAKGGAAHVTGVEIVREAVVDAQHNAALNNAENCNFMLGAAEKVMPGISKAADFDIVTLDPPRKGLDIAALDAATGAARRAIIYISCNPATLARDAKLFKARGWLLKTVQPIDMFPGTPHVECAALFSKP